MMFLIIGFLVIWGVYKGGFSFFFIFLMMMFIYMALKGGCHGWQHGGNGPHHDRGQRPDQQRPTWPEDASPYQGQHGAPGTPYQGSYGNEGTPTVRTDMNSGAGTVRVDNAPSSGQPTTPLREQPRPEGSRARVEHDRQ